MKNPIIFFDGQEISESEVSHYLLPREVIRVSSNKTTIKFVGILMNTHTSILSLPKHMLFKENSDIFQQKNISRFILQILYKYAKGTSFSKESGLKNNNLPYDSITSIIKYYDKYGIYTNEHYINTKKSIGRINWNRTLNKSEKIISGNNLVFFPLYYKKRDSKYTFISECMSYVLDFISNEFGLFFDIDTSRLSSFEKKSFSSYSRVVERLIQYKKNEFKDININLISSLITFFKFLSIANNEFILYTTNFDPIWETAINKYLNECFIEFKNNKFNFGNSINNFEKKSFIVDHQDDVSSRKSIVIDHFEIKNNFIYLFDSKYYLDIDNLNYKQVSYNYFVNEECNKNNTKLVINALILPTSKKEPYTKCHIDRISLDGVYIHELYLSILEVLCNYLK